MKLIYVAIAIWASIAFTGCGKRTKTVVVKDTVTVTEPCENVQNLVDVENKYRLSQGKMRYLLDLAVL